MPDHKPVALLVLVMAVVVTVVTAAAIGLLYHTAFERERLHLISIAREQVQLMEAMARFDRIYRHDFPGEPEAATLAQIVSAHESYPGIGDTAELTLAQVEGDSIVFLMRHRHARSGRPAPVPLDSGFAEPMRLALSGQSGTMVGVDYHGERVLAAYEPIAQLGLGVVAKVDLGEIRAPFLRAGAAVIGLATLLIALGTVLFIRLTNPIVNALREREQALELILESTGEGIFGMDVNGRCTFANRSALAMLGYGEESELLSRDMHALMHHSHADGTTRNRQDCAVHQALSRNTAVLRDDETLWRADGTEFSAEYRAYPMRRYGAVVGAMVTFADITQGLQRIGWQVEEVDGLGQEHVCLTLVVNETSEALCYVVRDNSLIVGYSQLAVDAREAVLLNASDLARFVSAAYDEAEQPE